MIRHLNITGVPLDHDSLMELFKIIGDAAYGDDEMLADMIKDELDRDAEDVSIHYEFSSRETLHDTDWNSNLERYWAWSENPDERLTDIEYTDFLEKYAPDIYRRGNPKVNLGEIYL